MANGSVGLDHIRILALREEEKDADFNLVGSFIPFT
jgi:hypothetical protein